MPRQRGTVVSWNDEKGYGFIRPARGGDDVFLHISDVRGRRRPRQGAGARFGQRRDGDRDRAVDVALTGFGVAPVTAATLGFIAVAAGAIALRASGAVEIPWVAIVYAGMSLVAVITYAFDKRRAQGGGRRVPEASLHLIEFAGGWPGALVAQQFFRHKRQKKSYLAMFWLIVLAHVAFWSWWFFVR